MDDILSLLQDFDVANFLPAPEKFIHSLVGWMRLIVLAGPLVLLGLGVWYYFYAPKKPSRKAGFRTPWSMGGVKAWQFTQRLAGMAYMAVGGCLTLVMLIVSLFFRAEKGLTMVNTALVCVCIEFLMVLAVWVCIHVLVSRAYYKDGSPRK